MVLILLVLDTPGLLTAFFPLSQTELCGTGSGKFLALRKLESSCGLLVISPCLLLKCFTTEESFPLLLVPAVRMRPNVLCMPYGTAPTLFAFGESWVLLITIFMLTTVWATGSVTGKFPQICLVCCKYMVDLEEEKLSNSCSIRHSFV